MVIKSAEKYEVQALFNPDAKVKYLVPRYQREYTWYKLDWDDQLHPMVQP